MTNNIFLLANMSVFDVSTLICRHQTIERQWNNCKIVTKTTPVVHKLCLQAIFMHMMINKTHQNIHEICFWVIWLTFTCDLKTDLILSKPHASWIFLWTSSIVKLFHILDIIDYLGHFCLDTFNTWHIKQPQPITGLFLYWNKQHLTPINEA